MLQGLQDLLGGKQQQQQFEDFIDRYKQGHPSEGISADETADRYQQIAPQVPADVYRDSAQDAFNRLTPDERTQFSEWLRQRASQQGVSLPGQWQEPGASQQAAQSPSSMADTVTQLHEQQPNVLQQLFGEGGALSNPIAKAAVAGIAAMAAQRLMSRR
jgi:hypothetical protein